MNLEELTLEQLKSMVYDETIKIKISQNNIQVLENEIVKKSQPNANTTSSRGNKTSNTNSKAGD